MAETTNNSNTPPSKNTLLPKEFIDAHHHFLDTGNNAFQSFLGNIIPNEQYLPEGYQKDVVDELSKAGVTTLASVHIECMPDNGLEEAVWVEEITTTTTTTNSTVAAIVASCDLANDDDDDNNNTVVDQELQQLKQKCPKVKGIRWILDCVGKFDGGKTATHIATSRHDGIDYLRGGGGGGGGYDGDAVPAFEKGFALLEKYDLSFDLQCAPVQLPAAAALISKYPNIRVVVDHLGKPRTLLGSDEANNPNTVPDEAELKVWRAGLKAVAALPNVYIKISMLGYAIPGWVRNQARKDLMRTLVRETVELFGPSRCMVATNWWKSAAISDADGLSDVGPSPVELLTLLAEFLSDFSEEDRQKIFCGTAKDFYKI